MEVISEEKTAEDTVVKLDARYSNPQKEVDMTIEYSLDNENKIKTIQISATNFDISKYNSAVQVVIWKTIEEAKNASISGGSLTIQAFKDALK